MKRNAINNNIYNNDLQRPSGTFNMSGGLDSPFWDPILTPYEEIFFSPLIKKKKEKPCTTSFGKLSPKSSDSSIEYADLVADKGTKTDTKTDTKTFNIKPFVKTFNMLRKYTLEIFDIINKDLPAGAKLILDIQELKINHFVFPRTKELYDICITIYKYIKLMVNFSKDVIRIIDRK